MRTVHDQAAAASDALYLALSGPDGLDAETVEVLDQFLAVALLMAATAHTHPSEAESRDVLRDATDMLGGMLPDDDAEAWADYSRGRQ